MRFVFVTIYFIFLMFFAQSIWHTMYIHGFEFKPAQVDWESAHAIGDRAGMAAAFEKEKVAHCRTIDPFWFYGPLANKCHGELN